MSTTKDIWFNKLDLLKINEFCSNTLISHLNIEITNFGSNWIEGIMPVSKNTVQPLNYLHGGASVVLAETLGSLGSNLMLDQDKNSAFGQNIFANHIRPVPINNDVIGRATLTYKGRQTHIWEIEIKSNNKIISKSTLTMFITSKKIA